MNDNITQQFRKMYESLAGQVHPAAGPTEAAEIVVSILQAANAERVALGELSQDFRHLLENRCVEVGLDVIGPPFNSAELLQALDSAQVGVSWAAIAIAETGTLVELTTDDALRLVSALPEVHIGVFRAAG